MTGLETILIVLLILVVIGIILFMLDYYRVLSLGVFPETWFYLRDELKNELTNTDPSASSGASPNIPSSLPPDPAPPTNDQVVTPAEPDPTPPTNDQVVTPAPPPPPPKPKYIGCYGDLPWQPKPGRRSDVNVANRTNDDRALPIFGGEPRTIAECNEEAKKRGSKYFGMQDYGGDKAQCWLSSPTRNYDIDGASTSCDIVSTGDALGRGWTNAIYEAI